MIYTHRDSYLLRFYPGMEYACRVHTLLEAYSDDPDGERRRVHVLELLNGQPAPNNHLARILPLLWRLQTISDERAAQEWLPRVCVYHPSHVSPPEAMMRVDGSQSEYRLYPAAYGLHVAVLAALAQPTTGTTIGGEPIGSVCESARESLRRMASFARLAL